MSRNVGVKGWIDVDIDVDIYKTDFDTFNGVLRKTKTEDCICGVDTIGEAVDGLRDKPYWDRVKSITIWNINSKYGSDPAMDVYLK